LADAPAKQRRRLHTVNAREPDFRVTMPPQRGRRARERKRIGRNRLQLVQLFCFSFELDARFDHAFHLIVAALLVGLGAWLAFRAPHGRGCDHCHGHPAKPIPDATDRTALWGLFLALTLSPCELFLPLYLTAVPHGWPAVASLSAILAVATLSGMLTLTWLTLHGTARVRFRWLDRFDHRLIGSLLCVLGVATAVFTH